MNAREAKKAMEPDNKDYYLARAEAELSLGDEAADDRAAWAHFQLAGRYFDLAFGGAGAEAMPAQPMLERRDAA